MALVELKRESLRLIGTWALRSLGILVLSLVVLRLLGRVGAWSESLRTRLDGWLRKRGRGLGYRTVEVLSVEVLVQLNHSLLVALRAITSVAVLYVWVVVVGALVGQASRVVDYFVRPVIGAVAALGASLLAFVPNLVSLGVILVVAWFVTRVVGQFADAVSEGRMKLSWLHADLASPTKRIVTFGIWIVALVMGHPYLPGSESRAFQGVAVVFGVLISLGSSSVVGNALAGLVLTYSRSYKPGDRVKIGDVVGDVVDLGPFNTRLRTTKDEEVIVPNAVVMGASVVNYSSFAAEGGVQISAKVTIGYDAPWRTVHRLLVTAAERTPDLLATPSPYVLQTSLDDFYVSYEVRAYCDRPRELHLVSAALNQSIQDTFFAEGVEICSPHYEAFRDGNASTIPKAKTGQEPPPAPGRPQHHS
ncbi:MAG: mechanosensitive ion channel [Myxococcales bacterium]|nr:mechanosensitive ion channel [Myxococcales bacterium]